MWAYLEKMTLCVGQKASRLSAEELIPTHGASYSSDPTHIIAPNLANHLPTRIGRRPHNDDPEADMVGAALGFEAQAGGGAAGPAVVAPGAAAAHP